MSDLEKLTEGAMILAGNGTVWSGLHVRLNVTGVVDAVARTATGAVLVRHAQRAPLGSAESARLRELGWREDATGWRWEAAPQPLSRQGLTEGESA